MATGKTLPHVLIVDDEAELVEELLDFLTSQKFPAEAVGNASTALERIEADPTISVLLSDIRMPHIDGLTLARAALSRRTDEFPLEVVMLTGNGTMADAAEAVRTRAIDLLFKPVRPSSLKSALIRAGEASQKRRERWEQEQAVRAAAAGQNNPPQSPNASRSEEVFLSLINHELRTPLTPIIGLSDLIESELDSLSPTDLRSFAGEIRTSGQRLERAITRVTELASLVSGRAKAALTPCDAQRIMDETRSICASRVADREQTIRVANAIAHPVMTDRRRVVRILTELVDNASRFSAERSEILMSAHETEDMIVFQVEDRGKGMTPEQIIVALQQFQQLDMSHTRHIEGLGIGLCLGVRLAKLLGGHLTLASEPGNGTVAALLLPKSTTAAAPV